MVCLGDKVKKGMTAIRFYLLEDIDIFYDGQWTRPLGVRVQKVQKVQRVQRVVVGACGASSDKAIQPP